MSQERTKPEHFSRNVWRYGREEPLPERRLLRAGPLTAVLEGGDLRYIRLGNDLVVLRLYAAIRDHNWNTIEPRYLSYDVREDEQGFAVTFTAENVAGDVDFAWEGRITGTQDGVIQASMRGVARRDFQKNRIGWCVLHPMELAGVAAITETPEGTVSGVFPDLISPHQPFFNMTSIAYATPAGDEVTIRFTGDLFEMEDQRNWTDASYKTYSTPLHIPYPVTIKSGEVVEQTVTVQASGGQSAFDASAKPVEVTVLDEGARALPPIGIGVAGHGEPLLDREIALLAALRPAHVHVVLDLGKENWRQRLAYAADHAVALHASLAVEAISGDAGEGLGRLSSALVSANVPVARFLIYPKNGMVTTSAVLTAARRAAGAAGLEAPIGGGARSYFTEFNRATLPLDEMDVASYTINPQVHAFDNASLTETLLAQAETVRSAQAIVGEMPIAVGPITLSPRFNPNATGADPETPPGALPPSVDCRQPSLFAAAWLAGSVNALGHAGVDALTYFETTGWKGVMERSDHPLRVLAFHSWPGMVFPSYHVLADIAEFRGGELLPVKVSNPLQVQAVALRHGDNLRVILANMSDSTVQTTLQLPAHDGATLRRLDADTAFYAASEPEQFRQSAVPWERDSTVELPPGGLVTIDMQGAKD